MNWYSISIQPGTQLHTIAYCRNRDLLEILIDCLKAAGVHGVSEEPLDGWVCAYCGEVNKKSRCGGCGNYAPVPVEEG